MTDPDNAPADAPQGYQRFDSETDFQAAVDRLLLQPGRELRIFDATLAALKLNSPARIDLLRAFLAASRAHRIYMAVHDTDHVANHCPRMMNLLALNSHAVQIYRTSEGIRNLQDSFIVLDSSHFVRRPVGRFFRGAASIGDEAEAQAMRGRFQEIWNASLPGVSSTTSGL